MSEKNIALADAYYKAMNNKDLASMGHYFHPHIQFLGPLAELSGKEAVLTGVSRILPLFKNVTIRSKFGSENQVMMVYNLDCSEPIGLLRMAALLTFKDELISRMELFFDARPFEKKM